MCVHLARQTLRRCQMNMVWLNIMNLNERRIHWARWKLKWMNARHEICITLDIMWVVATKKNGFDRLPSVVCQWQTDVFTERKRERCECDAHNSLNWKVGQTNYTFFNTFPMMTARPMRRNNENTEWQRKTRHKRRKKKKEMKWKMYRISNYIQYFKW